jgi:steroid delta-isomerase-like uncharacterized protein
MNSEKFNSEEANRVAVMRLYDECLNQGKLEVVDQIISSSLPAFGPYGGTGPEGYKASVKPLLAGFPDIRFTVHNVLAENDRVAVYWTWDGTHHGPFASVPPTGKRVHQEGMVMYRFESGKVAEAKVLFDRLGVFQQLGTFPEAMIRPPAAQAG